MLRTRSTSRLFSALVWGPSPEVDMSGANSRMNMWQAINNTMDLMLENDDESLLFGEDVGFGGVFLTA